MTTPWQVEWFTVRSGNGPDERRISGWSMTALEDRRFGACPVCCALVPAGGPGSGGYLDLTREHEQWHARTDFPDPGDGRTPGALPGPRGP